MRHLYTITTVTKIPFLNITGPINVPVMLNPEIALKIIRLGGTVFEHNPKNIREKVEVTETNYMNIKFTTTRIDLLKEKSYNGPHKSTIPVITKDGKNINNDQYNSKHNKHNKHHYQDKKNYGLNASTTFVDEVITESDDDKETITVVTKPDQFEKN
jgi:hypothetical protein